MRARKYISYYVRFDCETGNTSLVGGFARFHSITKQEKEDDIRAIKETYGNEDVLFAKQITETCEIDENTIKEI